MIDWISLGGNEVAAQAGSWLLGISRQGMIRAIKGLAGDLNKRTESNEHLALEAIGGWWLSLCLKYGAIGCLHYGQLWK